MEIKKQLTIEASVDTVYQALATQTGTKGWWNTRAIVGESIGEPVLLQFNKEGTEVKMGFRIDTLDQSGKIVWECVAHSGAPWIGTKLEYNFAGKDGAVELTFRHTGWPDAMADTDATKMIEGSWDHFTGSLKAYCETGKGQPWA
jgi:uncharacterized protein YndB with AHSA1/START domain